MYYPATIKFGIDIISRANNSENILMSKIKEQLTALTQFILVPILAHTHTHSEESSQSIFKFIFQALNAGFE